MDPATAALLCTVQKALGVLLALALFGRPAGISDLSSVLNSDPKTVRRQLEILARQKLVQRGPYRNGYTITERGQIFLSCQRGRFSLFDPTTTAAFKESPLKETLTSAAEAEEEVDSGKEGKNGVSPQNGTSRTRDVSRLQAPCEGLDPERAAANLAAFREEGVGLNHRVLRACALPHVTPDYIHAHADRLALENRQAPALLLHVVESEDPFPTEADLRDPDDRERYVRGEFAEYIEGVE